MTAKECSDTSHAADMNIHKVMTTLWTGASC